MTTAEREERLCLDPRWRSGGEADWTDRGQYLVDGANTYVGPVAAFLDASTGDRTAVGARMRLSEPGVVAVRDEVHRQRHRARASR